MSMTKLKGMSVALLPLVGLAVSASALWPSLPAAEPPAPQASSDNRPGAAFKPDWLDDPLYRASEALAGWWPADGHAFDLAGPNHGAPLGPVAFAKGNRGTGFSFPDGKGAITVGRQATLVNTFTLAVWVNPTAARETGPAHPLAGISGQRYAIFPMFGSPDAKEAGCGLSVGTNGIGVFEHTCDNLPCVLADDTPIKDWTHIAVVYAKGVPTLYVNGAAVKTGQPSQWTVFPGIHFGDPDTGYGPYLGLMDEPMVFDRALSADEIKATLRATRVEKAKAGAALSDMAFAELWSYLSGERAPRSLFAIPRLSAGGDETVARLRPLVTPPPVAGKPSVEELVLQLDDDDFPTRERATRLLIAKGAGVVPMLRAHLKNPPSVEVRARIGRVLDHFNDAGRTAEGWRTLRAVAVLSRIATPASRELLAELAEGPEGLSATIAAKAALGRSGAH